MGIVQRIALLSVFLAAPAIAAAGEGRDRPGPGMDMPRMPGMPGGRWDRQSDARFLSRMIDHHAQAVEMGEEALKKASDPEVRKWAEEVVSAQTAEIAEMKQMLGALGTPDGPRRGTPPKDGPGRGGSPEKGKDGPRRGAQKDAPDRGPTKKGADHMPAMKPDPDPDRNFVLSMIPHHAGAVTMSLPALTSTTDPAIRRLAKNIIKAQAEEIASYRDWLDQHPSK